MQVAAAEKEAHARAHREVEATLKRVAALDAALEASRAETAEARAELTRAAEARVVERKREQLSHTAAIIKVQAELYKLRTVADAAEELAAEQKRANVSLQEEVDRM